ncbi:MAG: peptidoglycan editing factor PgeF [Acidobacteria bacterium]|nr:peptidoglycan editing factor PgeF [Acidobacteriota bacterium]
MASLFNPSRAGGGVGNLNLSRHAKRGLQVLQVPALTQFRWLVHGFSTRLGGVSPSPNSPSRLAKGNDLNLGKVPWDNPQNVEVNRRRLLSSLDAEQMNLVIPKQIHSDLIRVLTDMPRADFPLPGDGLVTNHPGLLLSIQVADCLPILLVDVRQRVVAVLHCGWRGTVRRLAQKGVGMMKLMFGSREDDLWAAIGPGIRVCCFSVGEEVAEEFEGQFHYAGQLFNHRQVTPTPLERKYPGLFKNRLKASDRPKHHDTYLDLVQANLYQLREAGISVNRIDSGAPCTRCHSELFFSHRRDDGKTGRMMGMIGIRGQ